MILSDIGSNTLLLHPDTWIASKRTPNRLRSLKSYVENGGGLLMVGGYYSFQGINGGARYHGTPVEDVLPVDILTYDDRVEVPEGFTPVVTQPDHPILQGFDGAWPALLGFNEVKPKPGASVLATVSADYGEKPLLVAGSLRQGPYARLDLRHRPALAAAGIRRVARIRAALAAGARMARRRALACDA